jgi:hypothetical protein
MAFNELMIFTIDPIGYFAKMEKENIAIHPQVQYLYTKVHFHPHSKLQMENCVKRLSCYAFVFNFPME